jgi:hypothetical protein
VFVCQRRKQLQTIRFQDPRNAQSFAQRLGLVGGPMIERSDELIPSHEIELKGQHAKQ